MYQDEAIPLVLARLQEGRQSLLLSDAYKNWVKSSKAYRVEDAAISSYWQNGLLKPSPVSRFGIAQAKDAEAYWMARNATVRPIVPPVPNPPPTGGFTGWDVSLRPAFTPSRTIICTSRAQFNTAWSNLQPGDYLDVRGVAFTGQVDFGNKNLANWAEIHFDSACTFRHNAQVICAWIHNSSFIRFYGGDISNTGYSGIRVESSHHILWWDFYIHHCAFHGVEFWESNSSRTTNNCDLRGRTAFCGQNPSLDPHAEQGSGIHGCYIGSSNGWVEDSTVILMVSDQPTGAGIQHGPNTRRMYVELDARRCTYPAVSQVGGCAYSVWRSGSGPGPSTQVTVGWLYAEDCAGRAVETDDAVASTSTLQYTINYARHLNTNYDMPGNAPSPTNPYRPTSGGVRYVDCL